MGVQRELTPQEIRRIVDRWFTEDGVNVEKLATMITKAQLAKCRDLWRMG